MRRRIAGRVLVKMHHTRLYSIVLLLSAVALASGARDKVALSPRQELGILRTTHEKSLLRASAPALRDYITDLGAREKRCALVHDYKGAIAARDERQSMEKELARIDKEELILRAREQTLRSAALPDQIVLMPEQAVLSGVRREPGSGTLSEWSRVGASATWKLPDLPPGGYEVIIRYSCEPLEGGTLSISEKTYSLSGTADTTLTGPAEKNFGTLKVTDGSGSLTITARSIVKSNLMKLHFVKLIPANR